MSTLASKKGKSVLGRGLSALIPEALPSAGAAAAGAPRTGQQTLPVEKLRPHPGQPRTRFDDAKLEELAQSIASHGILQPLLVRRRGEGFEIIAGERRWRAAQRAGLQEVPVVVRELSDSVALEQSLIENIQREDLDAIEEARAFDNLLAEHGYTQERLATSVGKDRSTIANSLRLLKLPAAVQRMVSEGELSMGHARALLALPEDRILPAAREVIARALSVRATEQMVKKLSEGKSNDAPPPAPVNPNVQALETSLSQNLGSTVRVKTRRGGKSGSIEIRFHDLDELDRLIERLS
jgi:ParB family transcriptional regulator, chromosome partitioning protein